MGANVHNRALAQKRICGKPLAGEGDRQSVALSLDGNRFEQFIEELSDSLVRSPADEIATEIDRWIREIVLDLSFDRGALAQIDPKSGKLTVRHSWGRDHLIKLPVGLELARPVPWFDGMLMKGRTVAFSGMKDHLPEFQADDWITCRSYVFKSNVTVPIRISGEVRGALGFGSLTSACTWSPRLLRRLELVAQVFGSALDRMLAAEEISRLHDELNHLSRTAVMGELTASLTHQLNQPLGAILMNAEELKRMLECAEPDLGNILATVGDIIQDDLRATETIKGLHSFFRKGGVEKKTQLYIREVIADVVRMVRGDAMLRNVSLTFECPSARIPVAGDRIQLQQAILNLVLNAFDAISGKDDHREVSIRMSAGKDKVRVAVADSGSGINPIEIEQIFEPYFTTKPKGMGIGLAIARSIVKAHGGQISAWRNPDRGSTFEIVLPALQENI